MEEIQQTYAPGVTDPDATVVQPRFDLSEEQTAQPVVPLARTAVAWRVRRLPVALVLVSALVGGLVSVLAYRLYQHSSQTARAAQPAATQPQSSPSPELAAAANAPNVETRNQAAQDDAAKKQAAENEAAKTEAVRDEATKTESTMDEAAPSAPAEPAPRVAPATERAVERAKRVETEAAESRSERRVDEAASREEQSQRGGVDRARREPQRARRVDVITSPAATERIVRRHDSGGDAQPQPDWRDSRPAHRPHGRNIDRIRDIFGAPPPG